MQITSIKPQIDLEITLTKTDTKTYLNRLF